MRFLSPKDVAKHHNVSVQTVRDWCRSGFIMPAVQVGRYWAIQPNYIIAVSEEHWIAGVKFAKTGRQKGARNLKPYPKGVKRPRKPKPD